MLVWLDIANIFQNIILMYYEALLLIYSNKINNIQLNFSTSFSNLHVMIKKSKDLLDIQTETNRSQKVEDNIICHFNDSHSIPNLGNAYIYIYIYIYILIVFSWSHSVIIDAKPVLIHTGMELENLKTKILKRNMQLGKCFEEVLKRVLLNPCF